MNTKKTKKTLLAIGLGVAALGAVIGSGNRSMSAPAPAERAPHVLKPFDVASALAAGRPDEVVMVLGQAKHALDGALPAGPDGVTDDAVLSSAPRARRIILVADAVRADKLARRLIATGRDVSVVEGGLAAWDSVMDDDPAQPEATAGAEAWARYRMEVALRHRFGEAEATPAAVIAAPPAPTAATGGGAPKKREGC